jgi:hypothetical protein
LDNTRQILGFQVTVAISAKESRNPSGERATGPQPEPEQLKFKLSSTSMYSGRTQTSSPDILSFFASPNPNFDFVSYYFQLSLQKLLIHCSSLKPICSEINHRMRESY